jgi:hypothetical protein
MAESILVLARGTSGEPTRAKIAIETFSQQARMMRAVKTGALFWGIAIACVFVPILHFFLVPTFLILGPVLGVIAYKKEAKILSGTVECPSCHAQFEPPAGPVKWPQKEICNKCRSQVTLIPQ